MTKKSLGTKLGAVFLLGLAPTACADDIANPFEPGTGTGAGSGSGSTDGGNLPTTATATATATVTAGTGSTGANGTTVGLDDTGTATATIGETSTTDGGTTDGGTTTNGGSSSEGGSTASSTGVGSSTGGSTHVACPGADIPTDMGFPVTVTASSTLQDSEFMGTCGGGGAPDYAWTFTAPIDGDYLFDTFLSTFDTVLYVLDGECAGPELVCDDDGLAGTNQSLASTSLLAGQTVTVVVDAFGLAGGNITLTAREGSVACPVEEVTTVPTMITGQTAVATDEFSATCGNGTAPDQGYLFTAPQDGTYTFEITNNDFDTVLFLLDGNCGGNEVACNDNLLGSPTDASGLSYPMLMGEQVTVVVDGVFDGFGNFDLNFGLLEGVCPDADLGMMAAPFTVTGATMGEDNATAGTCGGLASPDYAWTWTSPETATYRFGTENTDFDTVIYVRDGADCLGPELACSNDTGLGTDGNTTATVAVGDTVTIVVDGNGAEGNFDLVVGVDCPAQDLGSVVPQTITDDILVASDQLAGSCALGASPEEGYTFTAPSDGTYVFETSNNDFDTILYVLDAVCGGNELGCNDNAGGIGGNSALVVPMLQDQLVTVVVEGVFGALGTFDLSVSQLAGTCPDEDLGDTGVPFNTSGDTSVEDNGIGGSCGGLSSNDYSYTWVAPLDGTFLFDTAGSAFDTVVYVNDASCGGAELSCSNDAGATLQGAAVAALTMGQTVVITVDGNGAEGAFDLSITESSDCCFAHAYVECDDPAVVDCVCIDLGDAFCCSNSWDGLCVDEAINQCAASC